MRIMLDEIIIENRIREDIGDIDALVTSINQYGLFHPIIVDGHKLITGFRRHAAHVILGLDDIEAKQLNDLTPLEHKQIELEENIVRKDLTYQEINKARAELHKLYMTLHHKEDEPKNAEYTKDSTNKWNMNKSAAAMGISEARLSQNITMHKAGEENPDIIDTGSSIEATRRMKRSKEKEILEEIARRQKDRQDLMHFFAADAIEYTQEMDAESVHLILFDPPWGAGAGVESKVTRAHDDTFDDDPMLAVRFMESLIPELYKVLAEGSTMFTFFGIEFYSAVKGLLDAAGFETHPVPCLWYKKSIGPADHYKWFGPTYETFFHSRKGDRSLFMPHKNLFEHERVPPMQKIHATEKPLGLYRDLIKHTTLPGEIVYDPCCGSGASVRAALIETRIGIGVDKDAEMIDKAIAALSLTEELSV